VVSQIFFCNLFSFKWRIAGWVALMAAFTLTVLFKLK